MFRKYAQRSFIFIAFLSIALSLLLLQVNRANYERYWDLAQSSRPMEGEGAVWEHVKQVKEDVTKDIWFSREGQRLRARIYSDQSVLHFLQKGHGFDVVEDMTSVKASLQDQLYYLLPDGREAFLQPNGRVLIQGADPKDPDSWMSAESSDLQPMQQLRYFEGNTSQYFFGKNTLVSRDVQTQRFHAMGHDLSPTYERVETVMQGNAKELEVGLSKEGLSFQAEQLRATLYSDEKLF